jgi:hypothetical protein
MFSATWLESIQKITMDYMIDPVRVYVGFDHVVAEGANEFLDDSLSANKRVTQTVEEVIEDRQREARLRIYQTLKILYSPSKNGTSISPSLSLSILIWSPGVFPIALRSVLEGCQDSSLLLLYHRLIHNYSSLLELHYVVIVIFIMVLPKLFTAH